MLSIFQLCSSFWKNYNSEGSPLPFVFPFFFWLSNWIYYRWMQRLDFSRWYKIHTLHHTTAIVLGSLSLYINDNSIFHERIGILWSMPYFMVDILDCLYVGHLTYILHGAVCLGLGLCNYNVPLLMSLRMNSKAVFIESSSILLYQVKQNRNPALFVAFAVNYTICRIIWIPIMGKQLLAAGLAWNHPIMIALAAFYGLQIHWWIKILQILFKGGQDPQNNSSDDSQKKSD